LAEFDRYSECFDETVQRAVGFSGKPPDFFMRAKVHHMRMIIQQHFQMNAGLKLLDAGCGIGRTDALLWDWQCDVVGVDISDKMIEVSRRNNPWAIYLVYDGETLPFEDESFDVVFSICVFHHVKSDKRKALAAECVRVLRQGGLFLIYEHNPYNPLTRFIVSQCEFDSGVSLLTREESEMLLRETCCQGIQTEFILLMPSLSRWALRIAGLFRNIPLGAQYCTYGKRF